MEKRQKTVTNYQKELDGLLSALPVSEGRKRLLLHACCAPCSSAVLEYLSAYFDITLYFYNPNIESETEFRHRSAELERLVREMGLSASPESSAADNGENCPPRSPVEILIPPYCHQEFLQAAEGLSQEPERGRRCRECFLLRLRKTAEEAARQARENPALAYDYICTTLSISPLKDAALLNQLGTECAEAYGLSYLPSDFKKRGRYQRSIELSKEYGLYRQNFCGCEFSKAQARERDPNSNP